MECTNKKRIGVSCVISSAGWLILLLFAVRLFIWHWSIINNPYPEMYREGAMLMSTELLTNGGNPYSLENQPLYTNAYGLGYPLAVYPFALIGGSTFFVHRLVTALFIIASCLLFLSCLLKKGCSKPTAFAVTFFLYASLLLKVLPLSRPDSMGNFLFLAAILIPWHWNFSGRSLVACCFLSICAFYTKAYFFLALPCVICYVFLFVSRRKGLLLALSGGLSLLITAVLLSRICETYFNNTFVLHINAATNSRIHLIRYLSQYFYINIGIIIYLAILIALVLFNWLKNAIKFDYLLWLKKIRKVFSFNYFNLSLIQHEFLYPFFLLCILGPILIFKMGGHQGAMGTYFIQFATPFLLIMFALTMKSAGRYIRSTGYILLLANYIVIVFLFIPQGKPTIEAWKSLDELVSKHEKILNCPLIVDSLMRFDRPVVDSGQTGAFKYSTLGNLPFGFICVDDRKIKNRNRMYLSEIETNVIEKRYDLIILTDNHYNLIPEQFVRKYYKYRQTITIKMVRTGRPKNLDIYEPI